MKEKLLLLAMAYPEINKTDFPNKIFENSKY